MTWLNYHTVLVRHFLVNLGRVVLVLSAVLSLFFLPGADLWGDPWPGLGYFFLALLDSVLPLSLLVATLFTVAPRAHFKELTALAAAGYSMLQIMWPLLGVAAAVMVYSAAVRWVGIPLGGPPSVTQAELTTAFHADLAYPMINVFAVLAGIILASRPRRKSVYSGFLSAFFLVVGFSVVSTGAQLMGRHGALPPVVAGWLGSGLGAATLWFMWHRLRL